MIESDYSKLSVTEAELIQLMRENQEFKAEVLALMERMES